MRSCMSERCTMKKDKKGRNADKLLRRSIRETNALLAEKQQRIDIRQGIHPEDFMQPMARVISVYPEERR